MKLKRFNARTLLSYSTEQLWGMLAGEFIIVFEDGKEILTNHRETIYSSYFWQFHRDYPLTPIFSNHHVSFAMKKGYLVSRTHIKLLQEIYWCVADTYLLTIPAARDSLTKQIYEITNRVYVEIAERAEAHVTSTDILDFIGITSHPAVSKILSEVTTTRESISQATDDIAYLIHNDPVLALNPLVRAVRGGMVNEKQIMQCVGVCGYMPDVDSHIIQTPILRNYTIGMKSMYNLCTESRPAAMSLYFSESPLQDAEYFARRLQILCMTIENVHYEDCGSTRYKSWRVKAPTENSDGEKLYEGDLVYLVGKYYLDETTNTLKIITLKDTHLNDTTIQFRSVLHCRHHDKHGVCSVCFGQMADNLNPNGNIGHVSATTVTKQTAQAVLSTKHLVGNSVSEPIMLGELARRYFMLGKQTGSYVLKDEMFRHGAVRMIVPQDQAFGLTDINVVPNIDDVNPSRISSIDIVGFEHNIDGTPHIMHVTISQNKRMGMFTLEFLKYLKIHKWELDGKGNFIFDLQRWEMDKPIFVLPEMVYSYANHSHQVAEVIESRMKNITDRLKSNSPESTLVELFDLINSKLEVNVALLEIIIYASMIADGENNNYDLARGSEKQALGVADMTIRNRSLADAYAYEFQAATITNPRSFYLENRPDSPFDVFICPKEVIAAYP